jgi:hypothetical protein
MERREFLGALTALGAIGLAPTETQASPPMVTNRRFHLAGIETKVGNLEVPSLDSFTLLSVSVLVRLYVGGPIMQRDRGVRSVESAPS